MAGTPKEHGPTSGRVAAALKRIRQEQGLSYAELARRLADTGHPILDTGLMKIEKGQRRVDVDDLTALAVALGVTPNRLLLPEVDAIRPGAPFALTPGRDKVRTDDAWAWAYGERPLGAPPASIADSEAARAELTFIDSNRRHYSRGASGFLGVTGSWASAPGPGAKAEGSGLVAAAILGAFATYGLDTRDIRQAAEAGILASLVEDDPETAGKAVRNVLAWLAVHGEERGKADGDL